MLSVSRAKVNYLRQAEDNHSKEPRLGRGKEIRVAATRMIKQELQRLPDPRACRHNLEENPAANISEHCGTSGERTLRSVDCSWNE